MALWLELVSSSASAQIVTGLGTSAVAALAAVLAHAAMHERLAIDLRWLRWVAMALPGTVPDSLRLVRLLFRPREERSAGRLRQVVLPDEEAPRGAGRRALAVIALGLAPGSYVVTIDRDRLFVHELPGTSETVVRDVTRAPSTHPAGGRAR